MTDQQEKSEQPQVGYGKPPKHTQFQKGQSGNPKGRPKKALMHFYDLADAIANKKVTVVENGRSKKISYVEAQLTKLYADAMQGKPYAQRLVTDINLKHSKLRKSMNDMFVGGLVDRFLTR